MRRHINFHFGPAYKWEYGLNTKIGIITHWGILFLGAILLLVGGILLLLKPAGLTREVPVVLAVIGGCCLSLWVQQRVTIRKLRKAQNNETPAEQGLH